MGACSRTESTSPGAGPSPAPSEAVFPGDGAPSLVGIPGPRFVPPPNFGYYEVSPSDATIAWEGRKVTGKETGNFASFSGHIEVLQPIGAPRVEISIDMASVKTANDKLTAHLKSKDFFDVDKYPTAHFRLTDATPKDGGGPSDYDVSGTLDLHGVTKPIAFPATVTIGGDRVKVKAEATINRRDFHIVYPGLPDDLIRDEVVVRLDVDAARRK